MTTQPLIEQLKRQRRVHSVIHSMQTNREFATMTFHGVDIAVISTRLIKDHKVIGEYVVVTVFKIEKHQTIQPIILINPTVEAVEGTVLQ